MLHSSSEGMLSQAGRTRRYAAAMPLPPPIAEGGPTVVAVELQLREALMKTKPWPPTHERAKAALSALFEISKIPSIFSSFLPLLATEVAYAALARRPGAGSPSHPFVPFHFEVVAQMQDEMRQHVDDVATLRDQLAFSEAVRVEREAVLARTQRKLQAVHQALEKERAAQVVHARRMRAARDEYELLGDEHQALEFKVAAHEEARREMNDRLQGLQSELHAQQRKTSEQMQVNKELHDLKQQDAAAAQSELHGLQRLLIRAHHASLRATGCASSAVKAAEASFVEQVQQASEWASALSHVVTTNGEPADGPIGLETPAPSPARRYTSMSNSRLIGAPDAQPPG